MNMLLKQKLKTIQEHQRDANYNVDLTTEKIELQNKYIEDVKKNKGKLIKEKTSLLSSNEEEIHTRQKKVDNLKQANVDLSFNTTHINDTTEKVQKLKGIDATLKEKRSATKKYIDFFEENDDCPTCEQHIDETFKKNMVATKQGEHDKFDKGIQDLSDELKRQEDLLKAINSYVVMIREKEAEIG